MKLMTSYPNVVFFRFRVFIKDYSFSLRDNDYM